MYDCARQPSKGQPTAHECTQYPPTPYKWYASGIYLQLWVGKYDAALGQLNSDVQQHRMHSSGDTCIHAYQYADECSMRLNNCIT